MSSFSRSDRISSAGGLNGPTVLDAGSVQDDAGDGIADRAVAETEAVH